MTIVIERARGERLLIEAENVTKVIGHIRQRECSTSLSLFSDVSASCVGNHECHVFALLAEVVGAVYASGAKTREGLTKEALVALADRDVSRKGSLKLARAIAAEVAKARAAA